jgi:branched-chain amino acid transport system permease protein
MTSSVISAARRAVRNLRADPVRLVNTVVVVVALVAAVALPLFSDPARVGVAFVALVYAYRNFTWNIAGGYCGQLSLAHASAFGIGAFSVAVLTWVHGVNPWLSMLVGVLLSVILGAAVSLLMSRLGVNAFFFALGTLALTAALHGVAASWNVVGATNGLQSTSDDEGLLHLQWFVDPTPFYYLALAFLVAVTVGTALMLKYTRFGRSLVFIREDSTVAASMGIPVVRHQAIAMALSMGLTAVGGALLAQFVQFASYESVLTVEIGVSMLLGTIVGGAGTLAGPIVGGIGIAIVEELLRGMEISSSNVGAYTQIIYGIIVIVLMRLGADGIVPMWNSGLRRLFAGRGGAAPAGRHRQDAGQSGERGHEGPARGVAAQATEEAALSRGRTH